MLLSRAGYRARNQFREQLREHDRMIREHDRMINHVFDLQIQVEEKFLENERRFSQNETRFEKLLESQAGTDRKLNSLIEIISEGRDGANKQSSQD